MASGPTRQRATLTAWPQHEAGRRTTARARRWWPGDDDLSAMVGLGRAAGTGACPADDPEAPTGDVALTVLAARLTQLLNQAG